MRRAAIIEVVGVVVPAHNEETLLPACLSALRRAVNTAGIPAQVLAVADTCTDQTVAAAQASDVTVVVVGEPSAYSGEASSRTMLGLPGQQLAHGGVVGREMGGNVHFASAPKATC